MERISGTIIRNALVGAEAQLLMSSAFPILCRNTKDI
jgi:hypothetical protein